MARARLRRIGDEWVASRRSLALAVPSVVLPRSSNILVNPLHPAFIQLGIGRPASFDFDPRLRSVDAPGEHREQPLPGAAPWTTAHLGAADPGVEPPRRNDPRVWPIELSNAVGEPEFGN